MKLTDEQTKKALEYCKEQGITSECEKCNIKEDCRRELIAIALDLINRKDEMINGLIAGQETLQKSIANKNAEIDRYKGVIKLLEKDVAEARKEFAERLENSEYGQYDWEYKDFVYTESDIYTLLKEMEGEMDGK